MIKLSPKLTEFILKSGSFRYNYSLKNINWFQVGGNADLFFKPKDAHELQDFLKINTNLAIFIFGVGSNIIIRDGGFRGCVIRLGRNFTELKLLPENQILVGAANMDLNLALFCRNSALAGSEFLSGIPGTIGGAIKMNAGAYGKEMSQILVKACGYDLQGNYHEFTNKEMNYSYRKSAPPKELIYTHAILQLEKGDQQEIAQNIKDIQQKREESQPIRSKTGGSSFKNPPNHKAWQLIDQAGCRGLKIGDAMMSEKHCNFMINQAQATAQNLEELGELVKQRVYDNSAINLEWEIKIIGEENAK